jgi:cytochrome c-type biogenesis protein CcmH/NrfF
MAAVVVVVLLVADSNTSPSTPAERVDAIAKTIKCPTCVGESVFTSQAAAAQDIRTEIARQVNAGQSDDQVRAYFAQRLGEQYLLTPASTGIGALTWVLPVVALVVAFGGLGLAFSRWRQQLAAPPPDDADRALVADARKAAAASSEPPAESATELRAESSAESAVDGAEGDVAGEAPAQGADGLATELVTASAAESVPNRWRTEPETITGAEVGEGHGR